MKNMRDLLGMSLKMENFGRDEFEIILIFNNLPHILIPISDIHPHYISLQLLQPTQFILKQQQNNNIHKKEESKQAKKKGNKKESLYKNHTLPWAIIYIEKLESFFCFFFFFRKAEKSSNNFPNQPCVVLCTLVCVSMSKAVLVFHEI